METTIPKAPRMLGISSDNTTSGINDTVTINPGTHNPADTTVNDGNSLLSTIFNTTISPSTLYFDESHNLRATPKSNPATIQPFLNWSSSTQTGHEPSTGYTTTTTTTSLPANVSSFSAISSVPPVHDGLSSMRVVTSATTSTTESSTIRSTSEPNWDDRALVAAALFVLALSLVAFALRIFCPIYHRIMGHTTSKAARERHCSDRDAARYMDPYDRDEMTQSINSDEVLLPFGTPATVMQPVMNLGHSYHPYHYPLTYMPYEAAARWSPQSYEQEYIVTQHIQPDIPQGATSGHQADKLVEILEFPSDHLNMGAIYRHNWDQMFDGVANESMFSYISHHPLEYQAFPTRHNRQV